MHKAKSLSKDVPTPDETEEEDISCYKLSIACVMHEITHRHLTFNKAKLKAVGNIEDEFFKCMQHERYAGDIDHVQMEENSVQFKVVKGLILHQLDSFETNRLVQELPVEQE